ncbi:MAG: hypothetical protein WBF26_16565 [Candidatus Sulfotelmatobacter sp.]
MQCKLQWEIAKASPIESCSPGAENFHGTTLDKCRELSKIVFMLLVIFGAGASYDSVPHHLPPEAQFSTNILRVRQFGPYEEFRPPLANQLFDDRPLFVRIMQTYPACKPLVNLLRGDVRVEQQLAKFEEQAKTFPPRKQQLAAIRYYLHEMLWNCQANWANEHGGITNHLTFLDAINRWRHENHEQVCIVTFNYDTMLEETMAQLWGWQFTKLSAYTSRPEYKLIKLHGSIDWGQEILSDVCRGKPTEVIDCAVCDLVISDSYGKVNRDMQFENGTFGYPALAIPVEKKSEFVCPAEHLRALADFLPNVTKIITIGWRATEQNFLAMLKNKLTGLKGDVDLIVVSGTIKDMTETNANLGLVNALSGCKYPTVDTGFSGLIRSIGQLDSFLSISPQ